MTQALETLDWSSINGSDLVWKWMSETDNTRHRQAPFSSVCDVNRQQHTKTLFPHEYTHIFTYLSFPLFASDLYLRQIKSQWQGLLKQHCGDFNVQWIIHLLTKCVSWESMFGDRLVDVGRPTPSSSTGEKLVWVQLGHTSFLWCLQPLTHMLSCGKLI